MFALLAVGLTACKEENDAEVTYKGTVVNTVDSNPFPNLEVKVTDGEHINQTVHTDDAGFFSLLVRFNEINSKYYLLIGDSSTVPVRKDFKGFGQSEIDLGVIEVEGPKPPVVKTIEPTDITANGATTGGEVTDDGRASVTKRGICYSTEEYPTIEKTTTINGNGKGTFQTILSELEHNTTYYIRAYATNRIGTTYGEQYSFTTTSGEAVVTTDSVTAITATSARCSGTVTGDGGFPVIARGICWAKTPDPTTLDEIAMEGSGKGSFICAMRNLEADQTYYVRAYATNQTGTSYGEQIKFQTLDGLPVVKLDSTAGITATGATVYATVVSDCGIAVSARGVCWSTTQYPTIDNDHTTTGKGLGSFTSKMTNLEYGTTYYVRAYATNATETAYSEQVVINTLSGAATVITNDVTNITAISATCGGNITNDGSLTITARGIAYSTTQYPTIEGTHTTDGKGTGSFTSTMTNLKDETTYYVRAYATNAAGTTYGEQKTFKTKNGMPSVTTGETSNLTAQSVICKGNVTGDGGVAVTARGICYGTAQYPTIEGLHTTVGSGKGEFTSTLSNLTPSAIYYIRAYATNNLGTAYGEQISITTESGLPVLTTSISTATATTFTAGGSVTSNGGYSVTARGICYSTTNAEPTLTDLTVASGSGNGDFSATASGLSANTKYYVRAYATNSIGTAYGDVKTITTKDGKATLTTTAVTNITALTATSGVSVTDAGGATLKSCGICWATTQNPTLTNSHVEGGKATGKYSCNMTELSPNTTYYVRAYATTDITTVYGNQVSFTTTSGLPVVTTTTATATSTTITTGGSISSDGGYNITARGVCYSKTNANPTLADAYTTDGSGTGSYSSTITNVSVSTNYYVRAYATNSIGTAYAQTVTVTTGDGLPTVITTVIGENVTETTAVSGGQVTDDGGYTITARGVCWSTLPYPTISDSKTNNGSGTGYFSSSITNINLTGSNVYYVRAYATNANGTTYGEQVKVNKENLDYKNLPTVMYGGYIYKIYDGLGVVSDHQSAKQACEDLMFAGYNDWFMPSSTEVEGFLSAKGLLNVYSVNKSTLNFEGINCMWIEQLYNYCYMIWYHDYEEKYYWCLVKAYYFPSVSYNPRAVAVRKYLADS